MSTVAAVEKAATELDKALLAAEKRAGRALSGVSALGSPRRAAAAASASAASPSAPLTEATGRMLVHAVRTLAAVQAQKVRVAFESYAKRVR